GVPTAVVVTSEDRLVRPSKQRALAKAVPGALTFELAADHDACLTSVEAFPAVTVQAITAVVAATDEDLAAS
ncbi:MAG: hypothetical protein JWN29_3433, partial [Acidimicrobiales bacterium]|nr:hypothetical protein [Acidimicrobiales bacterium]